MNTETFKHKNIWFTGTGQFAALCLEEMSRQGMEFTRIITGNPTRSGRNNRENPSAVELKASSLGLNVTRTGKLNENDGLISALGSENPDIIFVIDFGQIIREPFLQRMCLNIHPSLLPEYRGAAPVQRAILDGRKRTGVTVFRLAQAMDAGEILAQSEIVINDSENASDIYARLAVIGSSIALEALSKNELTFTPQNDELATYAPKISKTDFILSFSFSAERFVNTVRALDMSGGAFVTANSKRLKIWRASVRRDIKPGDSGQVMSVEGNPVISCSDYCVELVEVQAEGKKRMPAREWAAGIRLKTGTNISHTS